MHVDLESRFRVAASGVETPETVSGLLVRVVDGDTQEFLAEVSHESRLFGMTTQHMRIMGRLLGVDTPEMYGEERERGEAATRYVRTWFEERPGRYLLDLYFTDSFGRWLMEVFHERTGDSLCEAIDDAGHNELEMSTADMLQAVRREEL